MIARRIQLVHPWCGNRADPLVAHVSQRLERAGYAVQVVAQSLREQTLPPRDADLVLQVLPAFTATATGCPVLDIQRLIADLDDAKTWARILAGMEAVAGAPAPHAQGARAAT